MSEAEATVRRDQGILEMRSIVERHRLLERAKNAIALRAMDLINDVLGQGPDGSRRIPDPAQLQNLRSLAGQTESIQEIRIYIMYQSKRSNAPMRPEFAEPLIDDIKSVYEGQPEQVRMECVRLYLGYLYRYAKYARR